MAGIYSLPPEVLVKIFVSAGSGDSIPTTANAWRYGSGPSNPQPRNSRDLYALATSTRSLYATFKANEYEIFLALVKEVASKFELYPADKANKSAASFVYRKILDCRWYIHERIFDDMDPSPEETEAQIERMCQQDIRQVIKPRQFGLILAGLRRGLLYAFIVRVRRAHLRADKSDNGQEWA